jgi:Uma2 family endonuclease
MRMATKARYWTRDDLADLPDDGNRYEVLDGALLVTPQASYRHQLVATRLIVILEPWCRRHQLGSVVGPGAVVVERNELQPDVEVVPFGSYPAAVKWEDLPMPILVVEIRSDSTYRRDVGVKRAAYQRFRIPEYWVIDPEERIALVWTQRAQEPTVVSESLRWQPHAAVEPLVIPLNAVLPPLE